LAQAEAELAAAGAGERLRTRVVTEAGDGGWADYDAVYRACALAFPQQSLAWRDVLAELGDRPVFFVAYLGGEPVAGLPAYLYSARPGSVLVSVPQPGPHGGVVVRDGLAPGARAGAYAALVGAFREEAARLGCATATLMTHPFADDAAPLHAAAPDFVFDNFYQYLDLGSPPAAARVLEGVNRNVRRNLRRAGEAGLTTALARGVDEVREWHAVHRARFEDIGAAALPLALFEAAWGHLRERGMAELLLVRQGAELAGGLFLLFGRSITEAYLLSSTSTAGALGANHLLTAAALELAQARGTRIFNWQSSSSRESGVYQFKTHWGSVEVPVQFLTWRTGDLGPLVAAGTAEVKRAYGWHYAVPFAFIESGARTGAKR
jgi:hypothetical protein